MALKNDIIFTNLLFYKRCLKELFLSDATKGRKIAIIFWNFTNPVVEFFELYPSFSHFISFIFYYLS